MICTCLHRFNHAPSASSYSDQQQQHTIRRSVMQQPIGAGVWPRGATNARKQGSSTEPRGLLHVHQTAMKESGVPSSIDANSSTNPSFLNRSTRTVALFPCGRVIRRPITSNKSLPGSPETTMQRNQAIATGRVRNLLDLDRRRQILQRIRIPADCAADVRDLG